MFNYILGSDDEQLVSNDKQLFLKSLDCFLLYKPL